MLKSRLKFGIKCSEAHIRTRKMPKHTAAKSMWTPDHYIPMYVLNIPSMGIYTEILEHGCGDACSFSHKSTDVGVEAWAAVHPKCVQWA